MARELIEKYAAKFNSDDKEYHKQDIDNAHAAEWMTENIPAVELSDKTLEEIYYFRWWVLRKHIKTTQDGRVFTEFLPPVSWAGKHNTIIAAAGHHISEAKWLKNGSGIIDDYAKFWFEEKSKTYHYSSWIIYSVYEKCLHLNDFSFAAENLDLMINYYEKTALEHKTDCGLYWSIDGRDAMECSISGTAPGETRGDKGIRPTLNSYMAANAFALSEMAKRVGKNDIAVQYAEKYCDIKDKMNELLWDGEFYKAVHGVPEGESPDFKKLDPARNAKELIGYIPWCFNLAPKGREAAFSQLTDSEGFCTEYGLATAEKRHPRFLYNSEHECLWNGYIWPFATTQVLNAVINLLDNYDQDVIDGADFYDMLLTYAKSHYLTDENGRKVCWIDEVKHPLTDDWSSRTILKNWGWKDEKGGFERGKDYNHSGFCDILLRGLLGISFRNGIISVCPRIPESWEYFRVDGLSCGSDSYSVVYDKNGTKYNIGEGLIVLKNGVRTEV